MLLLTVIALTDIRALSRLERQPEMAGN